MKKLIVFLPFILIFTSCEEDFGPKTDYQEKYALNCIVRGDTTLQYATIVKSYTVSGFDPYENTTSPFVAGADVRIWQGNKVYILRDTLLPRSDTSRYKDPIPVYYTRDFVPGENDSLEIRAILSDGKTLWAASRMPPNTTFNNQQSDFLIPPLDRDYIEYEWTKKNSISFFMPRITLNYAQKINGEFQRKTVFIPISYEYLNGESVPEYPTISRSNRLSIGKSVLDTLFAKISEGDPVKENYKIIGAVFDLLVFDQPLSEYYSSLRGFLDDLTIRVDEKDYTNIHGGFGIFGSYLKVRRGIAITDSYIHSFGYKTYIEN